MAIEAEAERVR